MFIQMYTDVWLFGCHVVKSCYMHDYIMFCFISNIRFSRNKKLHLICWALLRILPEFDCQVQTPWTSLSGGFLSPWSWPQNWFPGGKDLMVCSKLQLGFQFQDVLDFTARMKVGCLWILDVLIAMHLYGVSHLFMHLDLDFRLADLDWFSYILSKLQAVWESFCSMGSWQSDISDKVINDPK